MRYSNFIKKKQAVRLFKARMMFISNTFFCRRSCGQADQGWSDQEKDCRALEDFFEVAFKIPV